MKKDEDAWFAPKIFGYGAGLPIAWQGWLLLGAYMAVALLCGFLIEWDAEIGVPMAIILLLPATIILIIVSKNRTRGGWRGGLGEKD